MFSKSTGILAQLPPVNELFVMLEKKMIQPVTEEKKKASDKSHLKERVEVNCN